VGSRSGKPCALARKPAWERTFCATSLVRRRQHWPVKWSFKVARLAGIDVRVHATFFLLVAWVAWANYLSGGTVDAALFGVLLIGLLFTFVVLHELGHALVARRYGVTTRDITLLPIGGVARFDRMPDKPRQELAVALAGPAVNVALALGLGALALVLGVDLDPVDGASSLLAQLVWLNVGLAVFNMVPAFPMDGGRALRALLAMRMSFVRATEIAAVLGRGMAVLVAIVGLFGSPVLLFIAAFVWIGAGAELTSAELEDALAGFTIGDAAAHDFATLAPGDPIEIAVAHALDGFQHDFPVVDNGVVVGLLPHRSLLRAVLEQGTKATVASVMERSPRTVGPQEPLQRVLPRLEEAPGRCLLVVDEARHVLGIVTVGTVGELVAVREALDRRRKGRPTRPEMLRVG
jgi:Zn-dependent protease/CBS domain-containing protein